MNPQKTKPKQIPTNFVIKLYHILNDDDHDNFVQWVNDGFGFCITDEDNFMSVTLAKYYRHSNIASFIRQLNMYGFKKIKEVNRQYYVHSSFIRDRPELISKISRKPEKKLLSDSQRTREKSVQSPSNDLAVPLIAQTRVRVKKRQKHVTFPKQPPQPPNQNNFSNNSSLANIMNKSQTLIFHHYDNEDKFSICQNLQQKQNILIEQQNTKQSKNQMLRSFRSNRIFWSPSVIMQYGDI